MTQSDEIRRVVRDGYAAVAVREVCCGAEAPVDDQARRLGYLQRDIEGPAAVGNLGLGCGNPTALAALRPGEVVVDLGSGAGFDALVAAPKLGPDGRFIGVDMTPEMLERSRENAVRAGFARTLEFREGLIEDLPVASGSVDVVLSNCVINLSPEKPRVFREAYRVLKAGGRLAISDIVLSAPLPPAVAELAEGWVACISGAEVEERYLELIRAAGFVDLEVTRTPAAALLEGATMDPMIARAIAALGEETIADVGKTVFSVAVQARKP